MQRKLFLFLVSVSALTLLGGCATTPVSMSDAGSSKLTSAKLTAVHYKPDPFLPMTNTKGAFALLGVGAAVAEGKRLVTQHELEDPAVAIKQTLASGLASTFNMQNVTVIEEVKPYEGDVEKVSASVNGEGIVLDVRTFGWGTLYYPFSTKYKVTYMAQARLIDARTSDVISAERCIINEKKTDDSPGYDDLMRDNATLLKQKLAQATEQCTQQFAESMGVYGKSGG